MQCMHMKWHNKLERILKPEYSGLPMFLSHILVVGPGTSKSDIKGITEISMSKIWILIVEA